ncbi:hypothetical protein [Olleya sp. HaHaR_3_96]|uniref:hypothetical protein n=1 Tax=Olleya sp. HaHaR_3_96 TaxID=2745560 RepID=UPI001C4FBF28|nr:hypothetical protein [Olleya sp. HaHaR_3_96]QXP60480.1 hypothetical protein H0I26_02205 [Olleya sp. HaHaR_3_96]
MNLSLNIFSSIPCWLIPLLVGVICAILGYLLGRLFGGSNTNSTVDLDVYKSRIGKLETDLAACKASKESVSRFSGAGNTASSFTAGAVTGAAIKSHEVSSVTPVASIEPVVPSQPVAPVIAFDAAAAKAVFGKTIKQDDLTVVEGIGPKIKELFHNHDVTTWAALANCSVEKCEEVLKSGGKRFELHKPGTWPKQADLAANGLWKELNDWQDLLDGGR